MGVFHSGLDFELDVQHSLQAEGDLWSVVVVEPSKLPDGRVSTELVLVFLDELGKVGAPHLLLSLNDPLQVDRNIASSLEERAYCHEAGDNVAFVVARASSVDSAVL